ncbi:MAG: beta-N-acetylhexosaminidase [Parvicellaceae bacterium]
MRKNLNLLTANTILNGKNKWYLIASILFLLGCQPSSNKNPFNPKTSVIPIPTLLEKKEEFFEAKFLNTKDDFKIREFELFKKQLKNYFPKKTIFSKSTSSKNFEIKIDETINEDASFYELSIGQEFIVVKGGKKGVFYGLQTLFQLIVLNYDSISNSIRLPCLEIKDQNSFEHRGFLMDCCRHFFSVKTIKKYIDLLAIYKMNILHWHLTEDQGWRIEIDKYPKLNTVGSWREDSTGKYGGFYTKKEIREIVKYAKERYIEVIPEIELPGHSQAAIASYPFLSCESKQIQVANSWGVFKDIYCAGNDSVFIFLEDIFQEITELFPSNRIHIGGDEAPKFRWENCEKCQKRMAQENLKDEHELQSYFIERIAKDLEKKNKSIIGWDEIIESKINSDVTIQSWRGFSGGIQSVKEGKKTIMSPTSHCYFDYDINSIDLEKVYTFNPIPSEIDSLESELIIGGECNLWSERIPSEKELDRKTFPRLLAMSEVLWTYRKDKFENFQNRVEDHYPVLSRLDVDYGIESSPVRLSSKINNRKIKAVVNSKIKNLEFTYQWNNEEAKPIKKNGEIEIAKSGELTLQAYKNGKKYGDQKVEKFAVHLGLNSNIDYQYMYSLSYQAEGLSSLINGRLGSLDFKDGQWQGFSGKNLDVILSLDSLTSINKVSMNFYQYINSWIVVPSYISIMSSKDSLNWEIIKSVDSIGEIRKRGKFISSISFDSLETDAKYLKIFAKNYGKLPSWHEAAGAESWLFIDEIIVE